MKIFYSIILLLAGISLNAQNLESIQYQGQLVNPTGRPEKIIVHIILTDSTKSGVKVYDEIHEVTTSKSGVYDLNLGKGTQSHGSFRNINWATDKKYLSQNIDRGKGFENVGTIKLHSIMGLTNTSKPKTYGEHMHVNEFIYNKAPMHWLGTFSTPPLSPFPNQAYYNKADKRSYVYDGQAWTPLEPCSSTNCHTIGKRYCLR